MGTKIDSASDVYRDQQTDESISKTVDNSCKIENFHVRCIARDVKLAAKDSTNFVRDKIWNIRAVIN